MCAEDKENHRDIQNKRGTPGQVDADNCIQDTCSHDSVPMVVHVRPDLYRAFMRCVWMLVHEEGMSPLQAQNCLIEEFLSHHGC